MPLKRSVSSITPSLFFSFKHLFHNYLSVLLQAYVAFMQVLFIHDLQIQSAVNWMWLYKCLL